jgi:hypothetical protein
MKEKRPWAQETYGQTLGEEIKLEKDEGERRTGQVPCHTAQLIQRFKQPTRFILSRRSPAPRNYSPAR